jgi:membrane-bound lytic murein transglycosylase D
MVMKSVKFLGIIWILLLALAVTGQDTKRQRKKEPRIKPISPYILVPDSIFIAPTETMINEELVLTDTLFFELHEEIPAPDEEVNDVFYEQMDSLLNSSYVRELFDFDFAELDTTDIYPQNISDSVYIARLQNIQEVIPLSYNNTVKNIIKFYTERRREQVEVMLGLSAYYYPIFEEALDRYNMPIELKYLPVIESALNPKAVSRVGATGLWQFMYGTGKQMGLEVTSFVDERRDPVKSTDAAIRYLKYLYNTYNDWYLAIAAYNCGPGNVNRAIRRSGNKKNYWQIYYQLPKETRGYVPAFIAAAYVMNYYREHNLRPRMPEIPFQTDTLFVHEYLHFDQMEAMLDVEKDLIRALNPMYRRDVVPAKADKPYAVTLPSDKVLEFLDKESVIFAHERHKHFPDNRLGEPSSGTVAASNPADVAGKARLVYTVKTGDNLGFIASWYRVSVNDLRHWNNIKGNIIRVGQKLSVYVPENQKQSFEKINSMTLAQKQAQAGKPVPTTARSQSASNQTIDYEYYTVKKGDTVWEIARRYSGVTPQEILRLNNLNNNSNLLVGQRLRIRPRQNT